MMDVLDEIFIEIKDRCDYNTYQYLKSFITFKFKDYKIVKEEVSIDLYKLNENEQLFKMFMISKKLQGLTERTLKAYSNFLKRFIKDINKPLTNVESNDIKCYLACKQLSGTCSNITIDNIRRFLNTFFQFLEDEEYIQRSPMKKIKKIKTIKTLKKPFSAEEIELLKMSCKNKLEILIVEILLSTGVRVSELVNIKIDDINFDENEIKILGKGNKERIVFFNASTKARILDYLKDKKVKNEFLFTKSLSPYTKLGPDRIEVIVRNLGKKSGIEKVHPHRFRRTFASTAAKRGMPIEEIQKILGHCSLATTQIYVIVDNEDVKRSHKRLMN